MKKIIRQFLACWLSLCLILAPTYVYASSTTYSLQNIVMNGAQAYVIGAKNGVKKAVNVLPSASKVGNAIKLGGGALAVGYAVSQIIGAGVDWVLDPANNAVKYTAPAVDSYYFIDKAFSAETARQSCSLLNAANYRQNTYAYFESGSAKWCRIMSSDSGMTVGFDYSVVTVKGAVSQKSIPISTIADKVISNAAAGHSPSQELVKTVVTSDFNAGVYDNQLDAAPPDVVNPPDVNNPPNTNNPSVPFDPSSIIAAINSVMNAIQSMASTMSNNFNALLNEIGITNTKIDTVIAEQQTTNTKIDTVITEQQNTNTVINDAIDQSITNTNSTNDVINQSIDNVVNAQNETNIKIGDVVTGVNELGEKVDAQGVVINDAVDRVIGNDNTNAQATQDVISQSVDKAIDADAVNSQAVQDAIVAQTDAITKTDPETGVKSLNLPDFCSWASTACEFIEWATADPQLEEPEEFVPEVVDTDKFDQVDISKNYINASGVCPPSESISIAFGTIEMSYEPLCIILGKLSGIIVACAYLTSAFMIVRTI